MGFVVEKVEGGPVTVRENALVGKARGLVVVDEFAGQGRNDVGDVQFDGLPSFFDGIEEGLERFETERLASNSPVVADGKGIHVRRDD